jgi:hypothetical protein
VAPFVAHIRASARCKSPSEQPARSGGRTDAQARSCSERCAAMGRRQQTRSYSRHAATADTQHGGGGGVERRPANLGRRLRPLRRLGQRAECPQLAPSRILCRELESMARGVTKRAASPEGRGPRNTARASCGAISTQTSGTTGASVPSRASHPCPRLHVHDPELRACVTPRGRGVPTCLTVDLRGARRDRRAWQVDAGTPSEWPNAEHAFSPPDTTRKESFRH